MLRWPRAEARHRWDDRIRREPLHALSCLTVAIAVTWPLVTIFATHICGDSGDPYQTLWGMRWFHDAVWSLRNPFFTDRVYYPQGSTLVFQTFDLPSTILMLPLWRILPDVPIYNVAVLVALAVTVYGMSRLVRYVTNDAVVGFVAGVLFVMAPYQFAHLQGHLHLLSMGWLPLYVLFLLRFLRESRRTRDAALAGLFLALASLASWYHLLYALVLTPAVIVHWAITSGRAAWSMTLVRGTCVAAIVYLALAGPLLIAIAVTSHGEPITGVHDASQFSADLYAFVYPNAAQSWSKAWGGHFKHWSGNSTENAAYVGFTLFVLAVGGAIVSGLARAFLVAAVVAAVLALGPFLHVDGRVLDVRMPYWYLQRALPALQLMGTPVRLAYVMYFGLVVAAAIGMRALADRLGSRNRFVRAVALLVPLCLAIYEYRPRPLITTANPTPAPMRRWAETEGDWAVLDVWDWYRPMWHATIHRKPMIWGYLSRVPKRLDDWVYRQRILRSIILADQNLEVKRVDRALDFTWDTGIPDPSFLPEPFVAEWTGTLLTPVDGSYELRLETRYGAVLSLSGTQVLECYARDPRGCEAHATVTLTAGRTPITLAATSGVGAGQLRLSWRPPGRDWQIVSGDALETTAGLPGLDARYDQPVAAESGLGREHGRAALRALHVRYVITRIENRCVEHELALPLVYRGEEARIYEVPATD